MNDPKEMNESPAPRRDALDIVRAALPLIVVVLLIVVAMVLATQLAGNEVARDFAAKYGYVGVFLLAVISGFNLIVPIPAVALMPVFMAVGLEFTTTVLVIAAGMTVADIGAFLVGTSGAKLLDARKKSVRIIDRLRGFRQQHAALPLVVMFVYASAAPFPNEVLAIPLGLMGYRIRDIAAPLLIGNLIFNTAAAFAIIGASNAL